MTVVTAREGTFRAPSSMVREACKASDAGPGHRVRKVVREVGRVELWETPCERNGGGQEEIRMGQERQGRADRFKFIKKENDQVGVCLQRPEAEGEGREG